MAPTEGSDLIDSVALISCNFLTSTLRLRQNLPEKHSLCVAFPEMQVPRMHQLHSVVQRIRIGVCGDGELKKSNEVVPRLMASRCRGSDVTALSCIDFDGISTDYP